MKSSKIRLWLPVFIFTYGLWQPAVCGGFFSGRADNKKRYAIAAPSGHSGGTSMLNSLIQSFHVLLFRLEEKANH
jgi:hypothetical protein